MDLSAVIARLQAELTGLGIKAIGGSADLEGAIAGTVAVPSVFVMPLAEGAELVRLIGVTEQELEPAFAVIQVVSNKRDATGAQALVDLATIRARVRTALVGWMPEAMAAQPVVMTGGRLLKFDNDARLWWSDQFSWKTFYRSTS